MGSVVAVFKERPFDGRVHVNPIAVCDRMPTIREIIADAPELPVGFDEYCRAHINGDLIPRDVWHVVRPRPHPTMDIAITFTVPLQGGGGGGSAGGAHKIASIAVLLVAAAVSGGALAPFIATGWVSSLAGAGIGIAGRLEIDALGNQT
jgi:hypothetical protein